MDISKKFNLLIWIFTPIKLYGGDGGSSSNSDGPGAGNTDGMGGVGVGVSAKGPSNSNPSGPDTGGGDGGSNNGSSSSSTAAEEAAKAAEALAAKLAAEKATREANAKIADEVKSFMDKRAEEAAADYAAFAGVSAKAPEDDISLSAPKNEGALGAITSAFSDVDDFFNLDNFNRSPTLSTTYGTPPYSKSANATTTAELTASMFGNRKTTTTSLPNSLGGFSVTIYNEGITSTLESFVTNSKGEIESHTTEVSIGNKSFSYDTHYWNGSNTQFGFEAELAADVAEMFGAKNDTARAIGAVAEIAAMIFNSIVPSLQVLSAASAVAKANKALGIAMAVGALASIFDSFDTFNSMFGSDRMGKDVTSSMMGSTGLGDGSIYELGELVATDNITEEYLPMMTSYNGLSNDSAMIPSLYNQSLLIKPTITSEEDNEMQSQQAVFIDYRGGLSEVLAPNLIGANEGSEFQNISIDKGTMESKRLGTEVTGDLDKYIYKLPNGYSFISEYYFNATQLSNFAYFTIDSDLYKKVYQLRYNEFDRDCTLADLIPVQIDTPSTKPVVTDALTTIAIVNIDVSDDDSPGNTTDNVKVNDYIDIYYSDTKIARSAKLTSTDIAKALVEVDLGTYYSDDDEDLFSYRIYRGTTTIEPETNYIELINEDELDRELWDEYTYAYTYYDSESGFESAPAFSSSYLKKADQFTIQDLTYSEDVIVDIIRLYRIGGYSTSYRLIAEIENDVVGGTVDYIDTLDEEYNPAILDTQNLSSIEDLEGLIEHKGSLFAFKNNLVYFSRPGKPNMWSEFNSVRVSGVVSGIASTSLGVLIFTSNSQTYLLGGTDKYNFVLSTLAKTIGCVDKKSIGNMKNTAIWLDYEGLMISVGSSISNFSKEKINTTDIGDIIESIVYDSIYYLIGTNYSLLVDFRYNVPSFQKVYGIERIYYNKGKIYTQIDSKLYEDSFTTIGDYMEMTYKAPMFIGNSYDILTEFNKINLTYVGDFGYTIYIDEVEISSGSVSSTKVAVEEIKLPSSSNEGLGLELQLVGKGEIRAFRYIFSNVNVN